MASDHPRAGRCDLRDDPAEAPAAWRMPFSEDVRNAQVTVIVVKRYALMSRIRHAQASFGDASQAMKL